MLSNSHIGGGQKDVNEINIRSLVLILLRHGEKDTLQGVTN
jgi:hypothetical protein